MNKKYIFGMLVLLNCTTSPCLAMHKVGEKVVAVAFGICVFPPLYGWVGYNTYLSFCTGKHQAEGWANKNAGLYVDKDGNSHNKNDKFRYERFRSLSMTGSSEAVMFFVWAIGQLDPFGGGKGRLGAGRYSGIQVGAYLLGRYGKKIHEPKEKNGEQEKDYEKERDYE